MAALVSARHHIETSWDYEGARELFRKAKTLAQAAAEGSSGETARLASFVAAIASGHLTLQDAEAEWTLSNWRRAESKYGEAEELFAAAVALVQGGGEPDPTVEVNQIGAAYGLGWSKLCHGMSRNLLGHILLRNEQRAAAESAFAEGTRALSEALNEFTLIGNDPGASDARADVFDWAGWSALKPLVFTRVEVQWIDFLGLENNRLGSSKILDQLLSLSTRVGPSALVARTDVSDRLRHDVVRLGMARAQPVLDSSLDGIEILLHLIDEKNVAVEYRLRSRRPYDSHELFGLKILNSNAVADYDLDMDLEVPGARKTIKVRGKLRDLSLKLIEEIGFEVPRPREVARSHCIISVLGTSEGQIRAEDLTKFPLLKSLLSPADTSTWVSPHQFDVFKPTNILSGVSAEGASAYVSGPAILLFCAEVPAWEMEMYRDLASNVLLIGSRMDRARAELETAAAAAEQRLSILRERISSEIHIDRKDIAFLMAASIKLREDGLRATKLRELQRGFSNPPYSELVVLIERLSASFQLGKAADEVDSRLERLETVFDAIYSIGQEYLTLTLWVNSDIATRAFTLLNIILFGSLGLAILTATIRTPVAYTWAAAAVFLAALCAFAYFQLVRLRILRVKGHFLPDHK
jgi:hypothetical protein